MTCELVFSLQEFFKILPGLAIFPLTFYLAWKKIGTKVSGSITVGHTITQAGRISNLILINHKDKPLPIFAIQAVVAESKTFTVEEFDPPLMLKALESLSIDTSPYSALKFKDGDWVPPTTLANQIKLYLVTTSGAIPIQIENHPRIERLKEFEKFEHGTKLSNKYNGVVYDQNVAFAIVYKDKDVKKTALVDISGCVSEDWNFSFNCFPPEALASQAAMHEYLVKTGFTERYTVYAIEPLNSHR